MLRPDQPLVWLHGDIKTLPFSAAARVEAGVLRPLPSLGPRCAQLRVPDADATWRIRHRLDPDAVVILEVFSKKTTQTPQAVLETCRPRLRQYDAL